jgi:hypothetical protein
VGLVVGHQGAITPIVRFFRRFLDGDAAGVVGDAERAVVTFDDRRIATANPATDTSQRAWHQ